MVKPPKTMQPEAVDLTKTGRAAGKAFQEDTFHLYMARKIDLQRQQMGLVLPPAPDDALGTVQAPSTPLRDRQVHRYIPREDSGSPHKRNISVQFSPSVVDNAKPPRVQKRPRSSLGLTSVLKRLQRRHGKPRKSGRREESRRHRTPSASEPTVPLLSQTCGDLDVLVETNTTESGTNLSNSAQTPETCRIPESGSIPTFRTDAAMDPNISPPSVSPPVGRRSRPDLFFYGICVLVNGYTNPDTETLQRILHRHGGDLEKYETSRITHVIAEHLSTAKANMYKRRKRNPVPVCHPSWITDCVRAQKLLPYAEYLLPEIRDQNEGMSSIATLFRQSPADTKPVTVMMGPVDFNRRGLHESTHTTVERPNSCVETVKPDDSSNDKGPMKPLQLQQTDGKYINGQIRTVGTDPDFLTSFFENSRLSFIGSYRQRVITRTSPAKQSRSLDSRRFVMHVDMDCFFASVVLRKFPEYRDKPVAISHNGQSDDSSRTNGVLQVSKDSTSECATCNYEARKYGIKKGMYLGRAKILCPELVVLQYDFDGYEEVAEQVTDILFEHASRFDGTVEQVSCDESYIELFLSDDPTVTAQEQAASLAEMIRQQIWEATQCTATVGVSKNKLLAKLATDKVKPNRSHLVESHRELLQDLELRCLHGIGYRTDRKLAGEELVTIQDVWNLGDHAESELSRILGPGLGKKIFGFCNGEDDRPVQAAERKTIGAENRYSLVCSTYPFFVYKCNYGVRFDGPYGVDYMIDGLAKEVSKRMENVGTKGIRVTLKIKQKKAAAPPPPKFLGHGSCHNLSKSIDTRNSVPTREWAEISHLCQAMFVELQVDLEDVRGMGIVLSKLTPDMGTALKMPDSNQCMRKWFQSVPDTNRNSFSTFDGDDLKGLIGKQQHFSEEQARDDDLGIPTTKDGIVVLSSTQDSVQVVDDTIASHLRNRDEDFDCDIAIPTLSQIHMSQVELLPSSMKKQIMAQLEQKRNLEFEDTAYFDSTKVARFRQTDVKRQLTFASSGSLPTVFRLAAVKSGEDSLADTLGGAVSLTQFGTLPLKMQLQIANNDGCSVGLVSPRQKAHKAVLREEAQVAVERQKRRSSAIRTMQADQSMAIASRRETVKSSTAPQTAWKKVQRR
ncbi:predicted protein [Phaeodactylum tricornutum CCAP 1055/1]|uniref:DNA repair protein REV1 n=2 Tax=Phaeodactylum tricornutum TaxID=2850 RepID=B7GAF1_PHATC|nr:predicted protein [Phaeodactylum tricornutum CCAP 1055/1]EEC44241.1 predicted protein [Phaeodactylum tricornutum CCAP 1055/1]|eukprot:XP_002184063.1 predicted protein [Phaeodactylum tricornutum CCAP 1055/1]